MLFVIVDWTCSENALNIEWNGSNNMYYICLIIFILAWMPDPCWKSVRDMSFLICRLDKPTTFTKACKVFARKRKGWHLAFNPNTSKYHNILHRILLVQSGVKVFRWKKWTQAICLAKYTEPCMVDSGGVVQRGVGGNKKFWVGC